MKRRIVIADDDPMIISLVCLRLEMGGYEVLGAGNGEEALALIRKSEPLAAILDIEMPRISGIDVLDAIKSDPFTDRLPVMMLTGERDNDTVMRAMGSGAGDYMVKPFQPDRLLERVNRLVHASTMVWSRSAPVWEL
ncbi:MAG TPA: response regulator [Rhizomicrobium sp.]|jgi:DNA-binding response OmpR family regulator|nr:response regulator [Rhizomicrobium sp.]